MRPKTKSPPLEPSPFSAIVTLAESLHELTENWHAESAKVEPNDVVLLSADYGDTIYKLCRQCASAAEVGLFAGRCEVAKACCTLFDAVLSVPSFQRIEEPSDSVDLCVTKLLAAIAAPPRPTVRRRPRPPETVREMLSMPGSTKPFTGRALSLYPAELAAEIEKPGSVIGTPEWEARFVEPLADPPIAFPIGSWPQLSQRIQAANKSTRPVTERQKIIAAWEQVSGIGGGSGLAQLQSAQSAVEREMLEYKYADAAGQ